MGKTKNINHRGLIILAIAVVCLVIFFSLIEFFTDWLWFGEVGYVDVFFKQLFTQLKVGIPTFLVIFVLVMLYLNLLKRGYFKQVASSEQPDLKKLKWITAGLSFAAAMLVTLPVIQNLWYQILQYANSTEFDITDPLFKLDISFYIFKLDFLDNLNELLIAVVVGFFALTLLYYVILLTVRTPDMFTAKIPEENTEAPKADFGRFQGVFDKFAKNLDAGRPAKRKLDKNNMRSLMKIASGKITLLGVIFFIMLAIDFLLAQFELLQAHNGVVYGAGFTDVNITLWKLRILCGLSVIAAVLIVPLIKRKKYLKIAIIPVLMAAVAIIGSAAGYVIQNFVVSPDELNKENQYLGYNIEYTQYAYGLDNVSVTSFPAANNLTAKDILDNPETIDNIRINDFDPAQQFYNQTQSIRQYYTFYDVDNDRYMINGEYTQTFLAVREIDESKISDTWLNKHLKYTHGYGVVLSRVDKVTASGQPDILIGNIPPVSGVEEIVIDRPEIYFGEMTNDYVIVKTDEAEFDYPNGDTNSYTTYEGEAGIRLNFINRIIFAVKEGSLKLFTSTNVNNDSRIIINRNIADRVQKIMPYLSYEGDPYIVVADGRLYWMMDAYTMSSNYPYSEPFSGSLNYIRNSVKVVVDAYNGAVDFYIVDENDPMARTMQKIYPTLFKDLEDMPESLQSHIRYPNEMFGIQARVYAKYHMEDIAVFYQSEDLWDLAYEIYMNDKVQIEPNYYIAKLPGSDRAEFFNSVPFTPKSKQNMTALLVGRNDGENYGQLVLYQFPKSRAIYGTEQIEAQIDQNTEISKEFTLWNSAGTSYRRGNLFVIPINDSILYVEPVYLEALNSSIPEVKRIIMAYNDQIAYGETLDACLTQLFGSEIHDDPKDPTDPADPEDPADPQELTQAELIAKAKAAYDSAVSAQKAGDWTAYGKHLAELETYLNKLAAGAKEAAPADVHSLDEQADNAA